jgi:hypothetical protein
MDLSRISVKDFETLSGEKMKFFEKVQFKLGQHQLRKSINEDGTFSRKSIEKYLTKPPPFGGGGVFSLTGLFVGFIPLSIDRRFNCVPESGMIIIKNKVGWIGAIISLSSGVRFLI